MNSDYIYLTIAKGDIPGGKSVGDVIDYIDGAEIENDQTYFSDWHRSVYDVKKVLKKDWLEKAKELVKTKEDAEGKLIVFREKRLDLTAISATKTEYEKFEPQPVIELKKLPDECITIEKQVSIVDKKEITAGLDYTFGGGSTAGLHYATLAALTADLGNLTGNLTATQIADVTETATAYTAVTGGAHTLTITNPNGYLISYNLAANGHGIQLALNGGTVVIDRMNMRRLSNASSFALIRGERTTNANTTNIIKCILNANGFTTTGISLSNLTMSVNIYGCVSIGHTGTVNFNWGTVTATVVIENTTAINGAYGYFFGSTTTAKNNVSVNAATGDYVGHSTATGYKNASSDATAADANWGTSSGNIINVVAADAFESTTSTDANFLKLKAGSVLIGAGATQSIAGNTTDFAGYTWRTPPSIGAYEYINDLAAAAIGGTYVEEPETIW